MEVNKILQFICLNDQKVFILENCVGKDHPFRYNKVVAIIFLIKNRVLYDR